MSRKYHQKVKIVHLEANPPVREPTVGPLVPVHVKIKNIPVESVFDIASTPL